MTPLNRYEYMHFHSFDISTMFESKISTTVRLGWKPSICCLILIFHYSCNYTNNINCDSPRRFSFVIKWLYMIFSSRGKVHIFTMTTVIHDLHIGAKKFQHKWKWNYYKFDLFCHEFTQFKLKQNQINIWNIRFCLDTFVDADNDLDGKLRAYILEKQLRTPTSACKRNIRMFRIIVKELICERTGK